MKPDILIFMSDQHNPRISSYQGGLARTPAMEAMAGNGTSFHSAYTPCPLCVPARMSFLSGLLPSENGVFMNEDTLDDEFPTFVAALAEAGYETTLIGRMHFIGENQRHGFMNRLVGDITPVTWKRPAETLKKARGVYTDCFAEPNCTKVIGGGFSPVQAYDRRVVAAALEWLERPHSKPQFILVGTYGPHFPYVAKPELYGYYRQRVGLPETFFNPPAYLDPLTARRSAESLINEEEAVSALAAYCGMVEETDSYLAKVRNSFIKWKEKNRRSGTMIYISDHGDQCGERRLYGKKSFFESSALVPMILEGDGIEKGRVIETPVSLLDIGPTVCAMGGLKAENNRRGINLLGPAETLEERPVISEVCHKQKAADGSDEYVLSRMVRYQDYKWIRIYGYEEWNLLFNLREDKEEAINLLARKRKKAQEMDSCLAGLPSLHQVRENQRYRQKQNSRRRLAEMETASYARELWTEVPEEAKCMPELR